MNIVLRVNTHSAGVLTNTTEISSTRDGNGQPVVDVDSTPDGIDRNGTNGNGGESTNLVKARCRAMAGRRARMRTTTTSNR